MPVFLFFDLTAIPSQLLKFIFQNKRIKKLNLIFLKSRGYSIMQRQQIISSSKFKLGKKKE
jgi:hypothetical protein